MGTTGGLLIASIASAVVALISAVVAVIQVRTNRRLAKEREAFETKTARDERLRESADRIMEATFLKDGIRPTEEQTYREFRALVETLHREGLRPGSAVFQDEETRAMVNECQKVVNEHRETLLRLKGASDRATQRAVLEAVLKLSMHAATTAARSVRHLR